MEAVRACLSLHGWRDLGHTLTAGKRKWLIRSRRGRLQNQLLLPANRDDRSAADSPSSGANAATNTSALTLGLSTAAAEITEPPYE